MAAAHPVGLALRGEGRLVVGFGSGRGYEFDEFRSPSSVVDPVAVSDGGPAVVLLRAGVGFSA